MMQIRKILQIVTTVVDTYTLLTTTEICEYDAEKEVHCVHSVRIASRFNLTGLRSRVQYNMYRYGSTSSIFLVTRQP